MAAKMVICGIVTIFARYRVRPVIVATTAESIVVVCAAHEIISRGTGEIIVSVSAILDIISVSAIEGVISRIALKRIGPCAARENVIITLSVDKIDPRTPCDRVIALAAAYCRLFRNIGRQSYRVSAIVSININVVYVGSDE